MKPHLSLLLVPVFLFCSGMQMFGQEKVNISFGVGFAETLNIGMRYKICDGSQIGLSIGTWPSPNDWLFDWKSLISISGDYYYHFGNSTKLSDIPPWYIRTGLDYMNITWDDSEFALDNNMEFHMRLGRDIYFYDDVGINLDAGVTFFFLKETGFAACCLHLA